MQTVEVMGSDLATGDKIVAHGFEWKIDKVRFDPKGNTGNQPRYLVDAHWSGTGSQPPPGYAQRVTLGRLVSLPWSKLA